MAERFDDRGLAEALAELGATLDFPTTPPLATAVSGAIRAAPPARGWSFGRPLRRGLALGLVAALLLAGLAAAIGIALGGLRITFGGPTPGSPLPDHLIVEKAFGEAVPFDQLRERLGFAPVAPTLAQLGRPDHSFVRTPPAGGWLTLAWGDRPGYPADPDSGLGVVITEFRGDIGPEVFEKMVNSGVRVDSVTVDGRPAWWVEGGRHFFFYRDENGKIVENTLRLVGSTLIWEQDGLTLRIEGAPSLDEALRIAESFAPL